MVCDSRPKERMIDREVGLALKKEAGKKEGGGRAKGRNRWSREKDRGKLKWNLQASPTQSGVNARRKKKLEFGGHQKTRNGPIEQKAPGRKGKYRKERQVPLT